MTQHYKTACVFGGTGFIGRQVVRELAALGYRIKVATRVPERAYFLKPCGNVGQVVPFVCAYSDPESIAEAVSGCEVVVNTVGILFEKSMGDFKKAHADLPEMIAAACSKQGVPNFIHMSSLGIDRSSSKYAASKVVGENAVLEAYADAVILRPSLVFGEDDDFFNRFAKMAQILPALPLIGGGKTRFQPVFVGDIADAVLSAIDNKEAKGLTYQLGGPETLSFKALYHKIFEYTGLSCTLISLPFFVAKLQALSMSLLPKPPLTTDQVESLKTDSIVSDAGDVLTFADLGLSPTAMEMVLPTYLEQYRTGGRFAEMKQA